MATRSADLSITTGFMVVRYFPDEIGGTPLAMPAQQQFFGAYFDVSMPSGGETGTWRGQVGAAGGPGLRGSLDLASGLFQLPITAIGSNTITAHFCMSFSGTCYNAYGPFRISLDFVFRASGVTPANATTLVNLSESFGIANGLPLTSGMVFMREVSRTVVPEPTTGLLMWGALLVLCAAPVLGRRRRAFGGLTSR